MAANGRYVVRNIDRLISAPLGGLPSEHDRACVIDTATEERHPLTGETQHPVVYFGTLAECHAWLA